MNCKHKPQIKGNGKLICKCKKEIQITKTWRRIMIFLEIFLITVIGFLYIFFSEISLGFVKMILAIIFIISIVCSICLLNYIVESIAMYEEVENINKESDFEDFNHKPRFEDRYTFAYSNYKRCKKCGKKIRKTIFWSIISSLPMLIAMLSTTWFFDGVSPFVRAIFITILVDIAWVVSYLLESKAKYKEV